MTGISLTFDDVLIKPKFSEINSRKNVNLSTFLSEEYSNYEYKLPIVSSNMDTVTGVDMSVAMINNGGMGCLHRFWSIEDNVKAFKAVITNTTIANPWVSVGIGSEELTRAKNLFLAGARIFVIDVAHAAQQQVVEFHDKLRETLKNSIIIVGNFASKESLEEFREKSKYKPHVIKVGIGGGSACSTRVKTGIGMPQLSAILECSRSGIPIIADGGCRTSGDIAKALAAGANMVMLGGMLAGTDETPGEILGITDGIHGSFKIYRGSASKESYIDQNKDSAWRTAEGESFPVPCKGTVKNILRDIEGGLRSSFCYVGAKNLKEFQEKSEFIIITSSGHAEGIAHGKNKY